MGAAYQRRIIFQLRVLHECAAFLTNGPPIRDAQDAVKCVVILDQKRRERRGSGPGWIRVVVRSKNGRTPIERHHWRVTTKLTDKSHAHDDILSPFWVSAMTTPSPEGVERFQSKREKGYPQDRLIGGHDLTKYTNGRIYILNTF
jgi:hypothetical protein